GFGRKQQQGNKIRGDILVSVKRLPLSCCFCSLVDFFNQIINLFLLMQTYHRSGYPATEWKSWWF
ncbi:hypothetical protein, partial [Chryseobacterium indoltheticum]|uniref:hypothetical protein n=1 Tax=Chryseobacterium indoltheticum TaxID=254 RepID=UPI001E3EA4FD